MSEHAFIHKELFHTICGDEIGSGAYRTVYECKTMPAHVIKVEEGSRSFHNALEWEIWHTVKDTPHAKWFAPCEHISPCGSVLIMARTIPAREHEYPDKLPAFLTDTKRRNYGIYGGRLVCHDYGLNLLMENGMTKRMRKVRWWG